MRRAPGFAAVAILTLALGAGANTAIFTVVRGVLLRPLPFEQPHELFLISHKAAGVPFVRDPSMDEGTYLAFRRQNRSFEQIASFNGTQLTLTGAGEPVLCRRSRFRGMRDIQRKEVARSRFRSEGLMLRSWYARVHVLVVLAACSPDAATSPGDELEPFFSSWSSSPKCSKSPDIVVDNLATLRAAVDAAPAGSTIAIDGVIDVAGFAVIINRSDITLTCATPGSGLRADAAAPPGRVIRIHAPRVHVAGLRLDGEDVTLETAVLVSTVLPSIAEDVTLTDNDVTCGPRICIFLIGAPRAVVARNRMSGSAGVSGVHIQGNGGTTDGSRVEWNWISTTGPSINPNFGGIRVRDGTGLRVTDNVVQGAWANGVAVTNVVGGEVARNAVSGVDRYGVVFGTGPTPVPLSVDGMAIGQNRVTGAGIAGLGIRFSCRSVFTGNDLRGNADNTGAVFFEQTGANVLAGNGTIVFDNGALDCDGDGTPDPNRITRVSLVQSGLPVGAEVGRAVSGAASDVR